MGGDEPTGANQPSGPNKPGFSDLIRERKAGEAEPKRGAGRPPLTPEQKAARAAARAAGLQPSNPPPIMGPLWNQSNTGAMVRLPFDLAAFATGCKDLSLSEAEQAVICPAAVDVLNQFAPAAGAKYAAVIALSAAVLAVGANKARAYAQFAEAKKKKAEAEKKESEAGK